MRLPRVYKSLSQQLFRDQEYLIAPIREQDRYDIMQWRNEQIYHLRQAEPLIKEKQDWYFENVVGKLFDQEQPNQILFSYLKNEECIGYGGLVHINWQDKHAEISFIMATELEADGFEFHWKTYLGLIEQVAFEELHLHKIFTYAFDIRPRLYTALYDRGFRNEVRLKDHCYFNGAFRDVVLHAKFNSRIVLRPAQVNDLEITYQWACDQEVRRYSISKHEISHQEHSDWFFAKLKDPNCLYFIAYNSGIAVGSFRLDLDEKGLGTISYLLSSDFHGKGLGANLLKEGVNIAKEDARVSALLGKVFKENTVSCLLFEKLDFSLESDQASPFVYKKMIR